MSWLFHRSMMHRAAQFDIRRAVLLGATIWCAPSLGAQVYVQPLLSVRAQTSSNIDLATDPAQRQQTEGYLGDAATVIGIATPRSDTTLRPRIQYQYFPEETALNRLEAFLDFTTQYNSPRSNFAMFGRYDHRDEINAERPAAVYNDLAPTPTASPETGRVRVGTTRDDFVIMPTYSYQLTQRVGIGASANLETLNYSSADDTSHVDFNYYQGRGFVSWSPSPRTKLAFGGYASKYDAKHIDSQSTSYGTSVDYDIHWSEVFASHAAIVYQRTDVDMTQPRIFQDRTNAWGANVSSTYTAQLSQIRFNLGRTINPSGGGGLYESDEARVQYQRDLSERWGVTTAARYLRSRALSRDSNGNDRNYVRANVYLTWNMTRFWFVEGGYDYSWQKYENDPNSAADSTFSVRFGYKGIPRQR